MPLLVVLGINGRQGGSVARAFLEIAGWRIRGLTSSLQCASSREWQALGVEILQVDLKNDTQLRTAFEGAAAIFAVTDYYTYLNDRTVQTLARLKFEKVEHVAGQQCLVAGQTIVEAAADVPGLQRFVLSTIPRMSSTPPNLTGICQLQSNIDTQKYLSALFPDLAAKASILKPGLRMEQYKMTLQKNNDGTLTFSTTAPGNARLPWIHVANDFGIIVRALVLKVPARQDVAAISEWRSGWEICELINDISGLTCHYRQLTSVEMEQYRGHVMADLITYGRDFRYYEPNVAPLAQLEGKYKICIPTTSFKSYLGKTLPRHLEQLIRLSDPGIVGVFVSKYRPCMEEMLSTSEHVEKLGLEFPRVNANGHDRSVFISSLG